MDSQPRVNFCGICAFCFIEEHVIARRVVTTRKVIGKIKETKLNRRRRAGRLIREKGRGRVPTDPPLPAVK